MPRKAGTKCPLPQFAANNRQVRKASMITALELTRRETLLLGTAALASTIAWPALAEEGPERHGMSAFGDLKYPAGFKHFDYVHPNAPKGDTFPHVGATPPFTQNLFTSHPPTSFYPHVPAPPR